MFKFLKYKVTVGFHIHNAEVGLRQAEVQCFSKHISELRDGIAQWSGFALPDPAAPGSFPGIPKSVPNKNDFQRKLLMSPG